MAECIRCRQPINESVWAASITGIVRNSDGEAVSHVVCPPAGVSIVEPSTPAPDNDPAPSPIAPAPAPDPSSLLAYVNREMARVRHLTGDAQIATAERRHAGARNAMRSIMTICESVVEESMRRG